MYRNGFRKRKSRNSIGAKMEAQGRCKFNKVNEVWEMDRIITFFGLE